jgi:hypothetical protein
MCNTAAVVVDRVIPDVPVRQWVMSTPFEMRLLLARNAAAFGELMRIFAEEVLGQYRLRAARLGIANAQGGALVFQHRFGGSLNLNTHLHAVVVDGVFEKKEAHHGTTRARFHALPPPEPVELTAIAYDVYRKFAEWLRKKGVLGKLSNWMRWVTSSMLRRKRTKSASRYASHRRRVNSEASACMPESRCMPRTRTAGND